MKVDFCLYTRSDFESLPQTSDSRLVPAEGEEKKEEAIGDEEEAKALLAQVKELARVAAEKLAQKNPNGKVIIFISYRIF